MFDPTFDPIVRRHFRCAHVIPIDEQKAWQVLLIGEGGPEVVGGRKMLTSNLTVTVDDPAQAHAFRWDGLYELTIKRLVRPDP